MVSPIITPQTYGTEEVFSQGRSQASRNVGGVPLPLVGECEIWKKYHGTLPWLWPSPVKFRRSEN